MHTCNIAYTVSGLWFCTEPQVLGYLHTLTYFFPIFFPKYGSSHLCRNRKLPINHIQSFFEEQSEVYTMQDSCPTTAKGLHRTLKLKKVCLKSNESKGNLPYQVSSALGFTDFGCLICKSLITWQRQYPEQQNLKCFHKLCACAYSVLPACAYGTHRCLEYEIW